MTTEIKTRKRGLLAAWRWIFWGAAAVLLLVPLVAMQFTTEVDWTPTDFLAAAVMIGVPGLLFEAATRLSDRFTYRLGFGLALLGAFFTTWANLAVGIVGDEGDPLNAAFFVVLALGAILAVLGRFEARAMHRAMVATAAAQMAAGVFVLTQGHWTVVYTGAFTLLWLVCASLFNLAAEAEEREVRARV